MELRTGSIDFSMPLRGSGPRSATATFVFPRAVRTTSAGLAGYTATFSGDDHHVGRIEVTLATEVLSNTVTVTGVFGLRDWSGNWDDSYAGSLDLVVLAELEPATGPGSSPPRTDLAITGLELNQAVQFFRAGLYLDGATTQPDNAIFMVARKATGVRVYVDWDASAGLPVIAALTGELIVNTGTTTVTLSPINPGGAITPRRDSTINQALANHTLNFMIPAAYSVGSVTISCRVFDQAAPANGSSGSLTRTIVFTPTEPLQVYLVGVALASPMTAAPTETALTSAMAGVRSVYPRGDIAFTGFTTITLPDSITGCPTSGCGDGFGNLMDLLRDLRGGSGDVYFGGLPAGVGGITSCVIGCSPVGDRVGAAFIDFPMSLPHELGHALGRKHARCVGCSPGPQNPDSDFPQYGSFNSDSIGAFGFDPTTNSVSDPASAFDFMRAFISAPFWVSPYTYRALLGSPVEGGGLPGGCILPGARTETLFLGMSIDRARSVEVRPSFHHEAVIQGRVGCGQFVVEFLDDAGLVLDCAELGCGCAGHDCNCWPRSIRQPVRFPAKARSMVVWEGDKQIHVENIRNEPLVRIGEATSQEGGVRLSWTSQPEKCWYLVHWLDRRSGVWRGVAPRQRDTSLLIPKALFAQGSKLRIRVLATERIATGYAEAEVTLVQGEKPGTRFGLTGFDPTVEGPHRVPEVLTAVVRDASGRQLGTERLIWYYGDGVEFARGESADLRQLPYGQHVIRAVTRGTGDRTAVMSWLVERTRGGALVHHTICDPDLPDPQMPHKHPHPAPKPCS